MKLSTTWPEITGQLPTATLFPTKLDSSKQAGPLKRKENQTASCLSKARLCVLALAISMIWNKKAINFS